MEPAIIFTVKNIVAPWVVDGPPMENGGRRSIMKKKAKMPAALSLTTPSSAGMDSTRSEGIFQQAIKGEAFGPHPGLADVRIKLYVYNPIAKQEVKLPNKQIDLLISSIGEVDQIMMVIRKAISDWIMGYTIVTEE